MSRSCRSSGRSRERPCGRSSPTSRPTTTKSRSALRSRYRRRRQVHDPVCRAHPHTNWHALPFLKTYFVAVDESRCVGRSACRTITIVTMPFAAMDTTRNVIIEASPSFEFPTGASSLNISARWRGERKMVSRLVASVSWPLTGRNKGTGGIGGCRVPRGELSP